MGIALDSHPDSQQPAMLMCTLHTELLIFRDML